MMSFKSYKTGISVIKFSEAFFFYFPLFHPGPLLLWRHYLLYLSLTGFSRTPLSLYTILIFCKGRNDRIIEVRRRFYLYTFVQDFICRVSTFCSKPIAMLNWVIFVHCASTVLGFKLCHLLLNLKSFLLLLKTERVKTLHSTLIIGQKKRKSITFLTENPSSLNDASGHNQAI